MARLKWEYKDKVIRFSASHEGQESEFYIDPRLVTYLTEGKKIYDFQVYVQKEQTDPYVFVGKFTDMTVEEGVPEGYEFTESDQITDHCFCIFRALNLPDPWLSGDGWRSEPCYFVARKLKAEVPPVPPIPPVSPKDEDIPPVKDNKPEPPKAPVEEPKQEQDEKPEPPKVPEVKPEEEDMVVCKRCQTKQCISNKYCKHCGESFVSLERCGKCGREVPKNAIYCPYCGKKR